MAVSCTPADLAEAAKCYCYEPGEREKVKTYLLAVIAGLDHLTPKQLADAAACYCYDQNQGKAVNTYLLCQAANGGTGDCEALEGANSPEGAVTPDFIGQLYHETGDDTYWRSTGLTDADWVEISSEQLLETTPESFNQYLGVFAYANVAGLTSITWNGETSVFGFDIQGMGDLTSVSFPNLTEIDPSSLFGGYVLITDNTALSSVSFPILSYVDSHFDIYNVDACTSLSFPSLVTVGGNLTTRSSLLLTSITADSLVTVHGDLVGQTCPALTTISYAAYLPDNGTVINYSACALTAATVNHILARAVANAGYVTGNINLSGGTSAAPSGQGIVDKATLIGRGVTVTTN